MYNLDVLEQIKKDAIVNHIPILMDETLDEILDILKVMIIFVIDIEIKEG